MFAQFHVQLLYHFYLFFSVIRSIITTTIIITIVIDIGTRRRRHPSAKARSALVVVSYRTGTADPVSHLTIASSCLILTALLIRHTRAPRGFAVEWATYIGVRHSMIQAAKSTSELTSSKASPKMTYMVTLWICHSRTSRMCHKSARCRSLHGPRSGPFLVRTPPMPGEMVLLPTSVSTLNNLRPQQRYTTSASTARKARSTWSRCR